MRGINSCPRRSELLPRRSAGTNCSIRRNGHCVRTRCHFLLPHFLKEGRGRIEAYFTRVFNPVWTFPDGFSWIEMLRDEEKLGLHAALTPTWSETAWFADYVLPMGFSSERHDLMSQESYAGKWIGFRQPVNRVLRERSGERFEYTYQAIPARFGKRMSSGSTCPGRLIPTDRWNSSILRVTLSAGAEAYGGRILWLDLRELGSGSAGDGEQRRTHALALHAQVRRVRSDA